MANICCLCGQKIGIFAYQLGNEMEYPGCKICGNCKSTIYNAKKYKNMFDDNIDDNYFQILLNYNTNIHNTKILRYIEDHILVPEDKIYFTQRRLYPNIDWNDLYSKGNSRTIGDMFAVNEDEQVFSIMRYGGNYYKPHPFSDLIDYQVIENGTSVTSGRADSAFIGALLAGTTGAIIGGSGSQTISNNIDMLDIVLVYKEREENDINTMHLIEPGTDLSKSSDQYSEIMVVYSEIISTIKRILERNKSKKQEKNEAKGQSSLLIADELLKLKQLLDMEVITKEEFEAQKRKLLSV